MLQATQVILRQVLRTLGCAVLATTLLTTPTQAQIGGLVRKAKDAATKKAGDETGVNAALEGEDVKYDATVVELTPARLDKVIQGLQASRAKLAGRPALVNKRDAAATRLSDLLDKNGNSLDALSQKRDQVESCQQEEYDKIKEAKQDGFGQRAMTDPAFRQKMTDFAMRLSQAQMSGDTAALRKLDEEMKGMTAPTASDSASVVKTCGPVPPLTALENEVKDLRDQVAQMDSQIQSMEQAAAAAGTAASGLDARAFAMARERIEMWLIRLKSNSKQHGLSSNELKSLNDRKADIEKAM